MKIRLFALIAMSATLGAAGLAAGGDSAPAYYCHSPIADGGYAVRIWPDGAAGTARISVGADSFVGVKKWETYTMSITPSGRDTLFQGGGLTLTMSEGRAREDGGRRSYDANFTAKTGRGLIEGRLGCSSPP